jgi:hypothetical protein
MVRSSKLVCKIRFGFGVFLVHSVSKLTVRLDGSSVCPMTHRIKYCTGSRPISLLPINLSTLITLLRTNLFIAILFLFGSTAMIPVSVFPRPFCTQ